MNRAILSIGTNSTRALVARFDGRAPRIILRRSTGTRVGEGLKESGHLGAVPMRRTLDAIVDHYEAIRGESAGLVAIATSALRRADNAGEFVEAVRSIIGTDVAIVDGEDEARYSFLGAVAAIPGNGRFGVVDTGGGSTEYATGMRGAVDRTVSCEIGAVRLTEAFPVLAGDRGAIDDRSLRIAAERSRIALAPIGTFAAVDRLAFVGGSATTTAAILRGNRDIFETFELSRGDLKGVLERLRSLPLSDRKRLSGINPQRADILLGGLIVLDAAFELTGRERAAVTTSDLLFGYLLQHFT
ncbi:MAG TPA: hypothetical protein VIG51_09795 [Candidatus Baltobacteraceae bacterium]